MDTIQIVLLVVFVVAAIVGYLIINHPEPVHAPLMSGTNALSESPSRRLVATVAVKSSSRLEVIFSDLAIVLAMINVAAGLSLPQDVKNV